MSSARALLLRGSSWTVLGFGASLALRLGGNLILTRLLFPDAFGLMALVGAFVVALQQFSDVGVSQGIIQNERGDERAFLDTAWVVQIGRGLILSGLLCGFALPFARFYEEPSLTQLLLITAIGVAISGFDSTKIFSARRHLTLGRVTAIEFAAQLVSLVAMVAVAYVHRSVWALVVGGLVLATSRMLLSHVALTGARNGLCWDPSAWRSLFHFGKWVFLSTILGFLTGEAVQLIFGRLVTTEVLGIYFVASVIANLPNQLVTRLTLSVVFPYYSRVLNQGGSLVAVYHPIRRLVLLGAGWALGILMAAGPSVIAILYDSRYVDAGWMVQLVAVNGWLYCLSWTKSVAYLARGEPRWIAIGCAAKLVGMAALIPLGFALYGFAGAIGGFALAELLRYAASAVPATHAGIRDLAGDAAANVFLGAAVWLAAATPELVGLRDPSPWISAPLIAAVVTAAWVPLAGYQWLRARNRYPTQPEEPVSR